MALKSEKVENLNKGTSSNEKEGRSETRKTLGELEETEKRNARAKFLREKNRNRSLKK